MSNMGKLFYLQLSKLKAKPEGSWPGRQKSRVHNLYIA